jgi:S-formylglutathione hydrolase FrmB
MERIFARLTAIVSLLSAAVAADQSRPWNNPDGGSLPAGCQHRTFYSPSNKVDIGYVVYLPPEYAADPSARFPVLYSLHGMGGTEWGNLGYAQALHANILSKAVQPMIMVFANGRGNTFYANAKDGSVRCETSLVAELIPHVDSAFRTLADREHRAVNGISMGGFGALMLAFKHPSLFGHASTAIAALVNWDTLSAQQFDQTIPTRIFGGDSAYFNRNYYPFTFVGRNADSLKTLGTRVRMATNPNDVTMGPLYSYNVAMRNLLRNAGIPVEFDSTAGSGHVADFGGPSGVAILKFHAAAFAAAPAPIRTTPFVLSMERPSGRVRIGDGFAFTRPRSGNGRTRPASFHSLTGRYLRPGSLRDQAVNRH